MNVQIQFKTWANEESAFIEQAKNISHHDNKLFDGIMQIVYDAYTTGACNVHNPMQELLKRLNHYS